MILLPTPNAGCGTRGAKHPDELRKKKQHVNLNDSAKIMGGGVVNDMQLLPTPLAQSADRGGSHPDERRAAGRSVGLHDSARVMGEAAKGDMKPFPTPNCQDHRDVRYGEARERHLYRGNMGGSKRSSMGNLREDLVIERETAVSPFGRYDEAVRRWEEVFRPAPYPTQRNRLGNEQLAPAFAEWMMGLPEGWVTSEEIGLTRAQQLKAIGNGVCPQQALFALHVLDSMEEAD